jgi:hypothetical protein
MLINIFKNIIKEYTSIFSFIYLNNKLKILILHQKNYKSLVLFTFKAYPFIFSIFQNYILTVKMLEIVESVILSRLSHKYRKKRLRDTP